MAASLTPTGYRALSVVEILERIASGDAEERREFVHLSSNAARSPSSAEDLRFQAFGDVNSLAVRPGTAGEKSI
jgi:hypothetical protein